MRTPRRDEHRAKQSARRAAARCGADAQRRVQKPKLYRRLARESIARCRPVNRWSPSAEPLIPMAGFIDKDAEIARRKRWAN
ncbi:hypothetical protein M8494_25570 [Serratia ureilytica]